VNSLVTLLDLLIWPSLGQNTLFVLQMPVFPRRVHNRTRLHAVLNKYPLLFGVPFVGLMVAASYGMTTFTQVRYDLHDHRVSQVSKEEALGLDKNRKKFDIREEYYRLSSAADDNWENKRVERPKGLPEWGVAPSQPPLRDGFKPKDT
jgi:cytochrome c oxidase assembly protein subunit 16